MVQCSGQPVLPVGLKDEMGADTVKIFCPKCQQVYHTPPLRSRANISTGVDGAAFGTTFPHLFLMTFSNLVPDPLPAETSYVPRVFGFRVHQSAQRTLPSPEAATTTTNVAPAPPAAAAAAAEKTGNGNTNATVNNGGNNTNNDNANLREFGNEDEDEKSPVQGEEGAANQPAAPAAPAAAGAAAVAAGMNALPNANVNLNNAASAAAASSSSAAVRSRSKGKRGRKDDKATAATAASATNAGTTVAPTFLMENPAKRRRRGAGNT